MSPLEFTKSIGDNTICEILALHMKQNDVKENNILSSLEKHQNAMKEDTQGNTAERDVPASRTNWYKYFVITVGDVKTTMNIRGVRNRSPDEFGSFTEAPGDFHTQGYIMQCIAKIMGPGGFYYVARQVLGRIKVTPNSFESIFKEGNFQRNFDTITDFYWGIMIACVKEFESSTDFPSSLANQQEALCTDDSQKK